MELQQQFEAAAQQVNALPDATAAQRLIAAWQAHAPNG